RAGGYLLSLLDALPICERIDLLPMGAEDIARCTPVYEALPGWSESTVGVTDYAKLPQNARNYLERIEQVTGVSIDMISTSPDRRSEEHTSELQSRENLV